MIIEIDWADLPNSWSDLDFAVVEEYWEDGEEWAHLEILNPHLQTWIRIKHNDWIIADQCP